MELGFYEVFFKFVVRFCSSVQLWQSLHSQRAIIYYIFIKNDLVRLQRLTDKIFAGRIIFTALTNNKELSTSTTAQFDSVTKAGGRREAETKAPPFLPHPGPLWYFNQTIKYSLCLQRFESWLLHNFSLYVFFLSNRNLTTFNISSFPGNIGCKTGLYFKTYLNVLKCCWIEFMIMTSIRFSVSLSGCNPGWEIRNHSTSWILTTQPVAEHRKGYPHLIIETCVMLSS